MTIHEACQAVGKTESTIRRWIASGKLEATKVNDIWDISHASVDTLSSGGQVVGKMEGAAEALIADLRSEIKSLRDQLTESQNETRYLREELRQKGQLVAVAQNTAQQLIERLQTPFWKRWFRRQKALPASDIVDMETEDEN